MIALTEGTVSKDWIGKITGLLYQGPHYSVAKSPIMISFLKWQANFLTGKFLSEGYI